MTAFLPRPFLIPSILYFLVSLVCTQIPLFNYLGFEFSFVIGVVASLVAGISTISLTRGSPESAGSGPAEAGRSFRQALGLNLLLLVIPVAVMSGNALFVRNCSYGEGLMFFFLLPVVSVWFSSGLGFFLSVHYRHPRTIFAAIVIVTVAYAGWLGYSTPAIFSYNFFYGFFPGLTYDEILSITPTLVLFRGLTVLAGLVLMGGGTLIIRDGPLSRTTVGKGLGLIRALLRPGLRVPAGVCVLIVLLLFIYRNELGFESHSSYIRSLLGSKIETDHLTLYYSDSSYSEEEIRWLAAEHEFRLFQIEEYLGFCLEGRLESFIYPSARRKAELIGAGRTSIAKPWSGQMHLDAGSIDEVLKHEMAHLVAAPLGLPVLHASIYPGLTEGLAMAVEWEFGSQTLHEHSAAMLRHGIRPDMERIMHSFRFVRESSSLSYAVAGSFCRFLADRYGADVFGRVYPLGEFEQVYGRPLETLADEWRSMLDTLTLDEGSFDRTEVYFRSPPIFDRVCPRSTALEAAEAGRLFRARAYDKAAFLYRAAYADGGGRTSLQGYVLSAMRGGDTGPAIALADSLGPSPGPFLPLFLTLGDAWWLRGKPEKALEFYERIACSRLSPAYTEAALVRIFGLGSEATSEEVMTYLLSDRPDTVRVAQLDSALAADPGSGAVLFLRGKAFLRDGRYEEAVRDLSAAAVSPELDSFRLIGLGDALFRLRRFGEARASYRRALGAEPSKGLQVRVADRLDRCRWFELMNMPDALRKEKP